MSVRPTILLSHECAELYAIYLDPAYVGKGVGRLLFHACVKHAKDHGFSAMRAHVLSRNVPPYWQRITGAVLFKWVSGLLSQLLQAGLFAAIVAWATETRGFET
jgi:GNAT superfamily N-acetyltransferase